MYLERNKIESLLCQLDLEGHIFPGFEFEKDHHQLCLLGRGGFSSVYKMQSRKHPDEGYVVKIMGFENHLVTSENFMNTVSLQQYLSEETPYVCRLLYAKEIRVLLDEEGDLLEVTEVGGEIWDEDGLHLQFILMEQLEDIISKDRFGNVAFHKHNLQEEAGRGGDVRGQAGRGQAGNEQAGNEQSGNEQTGNEQTGNEQTGNDKTGIGQTGIGQTGIGQAGKEGTRKEQAEIGQADSRADDFRVEAEVLQIGLQVGEALLHAHEHGVLHRDVKLENIFWNPVSCCYQLGDFGIAKYVVDGNAETVVYTDGYGAPEIERRLGNYYDERADIYSFGITLYLLLNDFKFPGSEGYYVNMVQYHPEFVFPAPAHASEGMLRIIRTMCQFYQENRYQSMEEVLHELLKLKNEIDSENGIPGGLRNKQEEEIIIHVENESTLDTDETETYQEYREAESVDLGCNRDRRHKTSEWSRTAGQERNGQDSALRTQRNIIREKTQIPEKEKQKLYAAAVRQEYSLVNGFYFFCFTIVMTFFFIGLPASELPADWQFWILAVAALVEAVLLGVREFYLLFGGTVLLFGVYSIVCIGCSAQQIMLLLCMLTGRPVMLGACALSSVLWGLWSQTGKMQWLRFIRTIHLSWCLLPLLLILVVRYIMILRYYDTRVDRSKPT